MKACTALPWSSARHGPQSCRLAFLWRRRQQQQIISSRQYASRTSLNPASPVVPESDASRDKNLGFHVDSDKKTVATAIGDLPLSPVMDPAYWEATTRHRTPKPKRGKAQNSLERQFRRSPFAWALASPIRQCTASRIRLPSFFLQDFNLIAHPKTNQPWWVPRSFARDQQPAESKNEDDEDEAISTDREDIDDARALDEVSEEGLSDMEESLDPEVETPNDAASPDHKAALGPSAYVLARQELIGSFTEKGSSYQNHNTRLFGGSSSRYTRLSPKAVWRYDMDKFILGLMRDEIVDEIIYLSKLCVGDDRKYIAKCPDGWAGVECKPNCALLWFKDPAMATSDTPPGPFAVYDTTHDTGPVSVPVHNIPMLLGPTVSARVKDEAEMLADGWLFMVSGRRTIDLQLNLWKLQGYLADYRELP